MEAAARACHVVVLIVVLTRVLYLGLLKDGASDVLLCWTAVASVVPE